jgi:hypothetical protein
MGWSEGSEVVDRVARAVCGVIETPGARSEIFAELVQAVLDCDCDTLDECRGIDPELDNVIDEYWGSDEEED